MTQARPASGSFRMIRINVRAMVRLGVGLESGREVLISRAALPQAPEVPQAYVLEQTVPEVFQESDLPLSCCRFHPCKILTIECATAKKNIPQNITLSNITTPQYLKSPKLLSP